MSLVCKLDPMARLRRAYRATLLRRPPPATKHGRALYIKVMGELALIRLNSRLTGTQKDLLFRRGMHQLRFAGAIYEPEST